MPHEADLIMLGGGAVYILQPMNEDANAWLFANATGIMVDAGYAVPTSALDVLLGRFVDDGFALSGSKEVN